MFNPARVLNFLKRVLGVALPFLLGTLILAIITALIGRGGEAASTQTSWRFWGAIVANMMPPILVSLTVFWLAGRFVRDLYKTENTSAAMGFLMRSRFGLPGFGPWMQIKEGKIAKNEDCNLTRTGGPGHLVVYNDSAVLLERAGRLTRVEGSGFPPLEPFEKVYEIVDLQPKRWVTQVSAMTKDGIPITWEAEVHYQIDDGGQRPTELAPYPLSKEAVFRAATSRWKFVGRPTNMDWESLVVNSRTAGALRGILARWRLDELIGLTERDETAARQAVQKQLEATLRAAAPELGAKVLAVKLDNLRVEDKITQQWIRAWRTRWELWSMEQLADGEAKRIRLYETAKASAQVGLIVKIARALQELANQETVTPRIVLMRLFSVLDRASFVASSRIFFPNEALKVLDNMKNLLGPGADLTVIVTANPATISVGGATSAITARVTDRMGVSVLDGQPVSFGTTEGIVTPTLAQTTGGLAKATLTSGAQPGQALVTVQAGSAVGSVSVIIN